MLSVTLTINAVAYQSYTRIGTIAVRSSLRDRAGTLSFEVVIPYTGTSPAVAIPRAGAEVVLTVDGTIEFGGVVQRVVESPAGSASYAYQVDCSDYVRWFDRYLVQGVKIPDGDAEGLTATAGSIVISIVSTTCNQGPITWDVTQVATGDTIPQQIFDFDTPSAAIDRIAKIIGYRWYVGYNRDVVFQPVTGSASAAPVTSVTWETDTTLSDLLLEEIGDQIVNVVYIKDAKSVATDDSGAALSFTETLGTADGFQSFFSLGYEPAGYEGTTVTVTPTVGAATTYTYANGGLLRENIDGKPGDGQARAKALLCLPNWGVRFEQVPPVGARVSASYPYLDIKPKVNRVINGTSISEVVSREGVANSNGVYEEAFSAAEIVNASQDAIKARAQLYLGTRAHKFTGSARAFGTGWRDGQKFRLYSDRRFGGAFASGVDVYVTDVVKRFATPDTWVNELTLATDIYGEL
jgi:hypothetical protein